MRVIGAVFTTLNRVFERVSGQLGWIAGGLTMVMMLAVMREVLGRYFLGSPSDWSLELCEYLLVGLAYLGAASTEAADGHIRIDFLYKKFRGRTRAVADIFIGCLGLCWGGMLLWQGSRMAFHSLATNARSSDAMMWPLFPSQVMIPIGTALLLLILIGKIVKSIGFLVKGER